MAFIESLLNKKAGEIAQLAPMFCVITDGPGHAVFNQVSVPEIKDKEKVVIILDHDIPAGSFASAQIQKELIQTAQEGDLKFIQSKGIGYYVMVNEAVKPGDVVVSCGEHNAVYGAVGALGLDLSDAEMAGVLKTGSLAFQVPETVAIRLTGALTAPATCKDFMLKLLGEVGKDGFGGKAVEFYGPALQALTLADKMTLCMLAGRTGAVTAFVNERSEAVNATEQREYALGAVEPVVALPGDLHTVEKIASLAKTPVEACFVGGCTGGSLEELRACAAILRSNRVATDTRLTIAPATNAVYLAAIDEGLIDIFIDCGAQILNPGCASCVTTSKGVVGDGETMLSASCYNYTGCNGTKDAKVFVSNATTVAASALAGHICIPNK